MEHLNGAELFASGTHNGLSFDDGDLDQMVSAFDALDLAGRIPIKLSHEGPDARDDPSTKLAYGWVRKLYRKGHKLLGDLEVPTKVANLIRDGHLRFCSIELLSNVKAGTRLLRWVPDALALLGSEQPAIGTLADLKSSLVEMSRSRFAFDRRVCFSVTNTRIGVVTNMEEENKLIEAAIALELVAPNARVAFARQYPSGASHAETIAFLKTQPRPRVAMGRTTSYASEGGDVSRPLRADQKLAILVNEEAERREALGQKFGVDDRVKFARKIFARDPTLAKSYQTAPGSDADA